MSYRNSKRKGKAETMHRKHVRSVKYAGTQTSQVRVRVAA